MAEPLDPHEASEALAKELHAAAQPNRPADANDLELQPSPILPNSAPLAPYPPNQINIFRPEPSPRPSKDSPLSHKIVWPLTTITITILLLMVPLGGFMWFYYSTRSWHDEKEEKLRAEQRKLEEEQAAREQRAEKARIERDAQAAKLADRRTTEQLWREQKEFELRNAQIDAEKARARIDAEVEKERIQARLKQEALAHAAVQQAALEEQQRREAEERQRLTLQQQANAQRIAVLQKQREENIRAIVTYDEKLSELERQAQAARNQVNATQADIARIQDQIIALQAAGRTGVRGDSTGFVYDNSPQIAQLEAKIPALRERLSRQQSTIGEFDAKVAAKRHDYGMARAAFDRTTAELLELGIPRTTLKPGPAPRDGSDPPAPPLPIQRTWSRNPHTGAGGL